MMFDKTTGQRGLGAALALSVTISLAGSTRTASAASPVNDRLRIATQNAAMLVTPAPELELPETGGNVARAEAFGRVIPPYDYDVVVFNEVFDDEAAGKLVRGMQGAFPYYVTGIEADDGYASLASSGLAIFSKWPFESIPVSCSSPGKKHSRMDPTTEYRSTSAWNNTSPTTPYAFAAFGVCHDEVDDGLTETLAELAMGDSSRIERSADCFATKGVAYVRVRNPDSQRLYHVFFTHMQASVGANAEADVRLKRTLQLTKIEQFASCLGVTGWQGTDEVIVLGDHNVNGYQADSQDDEWRAHFYLGDEGLTPGSHYFGMGDPRTFVKDSWVYDMQNGRWDAVAGGGTGGSGGGTIPIDFGSTMASGNSASRYDYIFFGPSVSQSEHRGACLQHTTRGYNLFAVLDGSGNVVAPSADLTSDHGGITSATSPTALTLRGDRPLSDHMGLSAEINVDAERCNPSRAELISPATTCADNVCDTGSHRCLKTLVACDDTSDCASCLGNVPGNLVAPGVAQWYRIDDPGTYTFRVNPKDNIDPVTGQPSPGPDNGLEYTVYLPNDLSQPMEPFGVSTTKSDPPGPCYEEHSEGCPYEGYTYLVPTAPFYVKVLSNVYQPGASLPYGTPWPKPYTFSWQKSNCEDRNQACALYPTQAYLGKWLENASEHQHFQFYVDRADSGLPQTLRFDAKVGPGYQWLRSIRLADEAGSYFGPTDDTATLYDGNWRWQLFSSDVAPTSGESVGYLDGDQVLYYLVVEKNTSLQPADFDFEIRWDTSLTWIHGSAHSWPAPADWGIALFGNTDDDCHYPFCEAHDEISLRYEGDGRRYAGFGQDTTIVGAWLGRFSNDQGWTPFSLTGTRYDHDVNAYGELVSWRNAIRVVDHFTMELLEEDGGFNGASDISTPATFYPLTGAQTLGPGTPDPALANKLVVLKDGGWMDVCPFPGDLSGEGQYQARVDVAGSVPVHFCIAAPSQCGKSNKFCCQEATRTCVEGTPDPNNSGYCP